MKNAILGAAILCLMATACKKEENQITTPIQNPPVNQSVAYFPLDSGSYWVFEHVSIDTNGNETFLQTDSVRIMGDSVIGGNTYKIFKNWGFSFFSGLYRDSANCIVNEVGDIVFAANMLGQPISFRRDSDASVGLILASTDSMQTAMRTVNVAAGSFNTFERSTFTTFYIPAVGGNPRRMLSNFAEGIGFVRNQYAYASQTSYVERRLLRYNIQ
ncbi:MAG: hypothetical protein ACK5Z2_10735 [Bacteroidota bacterium]|jgi:hypothetical protein